MEYAENLLANITEKVFAKLFLIFSNTNINVSDILGIVIIFIFAYGIYWSIRFLIAFQVKREKIRKSQSKILAQLAGYIITILALTFAFSSVGYSLTYVLLGSTALLVGLGFGLQQMFMDLISGVILLIDKNINYGDVVRVDLQGVQNPMFGKIVNIGLRTTILETIDNEMMIVPNSKMLQSGVKSLMRGNGSARFRVSIQVSYDCDMEKVKSLMNKAVVSHPKIDDEPKPTIIIKTFEENYVLLEIRFWMKEIFNSEIILSDVRFKILELFKEENISIPYPQRIIQEKK